MPQKTTRRPGREDVGDGALGDGVHLLIVRLRGIELPPFQPLLKMGGDLAGIRLRVGSAIQIATHKRGVDMAKVVITHAVQDIDRWLQGKAERAAAIESGTGSNVTDYVAQDGSNNIAISADVADVDAMTSMLGAPPAEVVTAMEAHGVIQPITLYIEYVELIRIPVSFSSGGHSSTCADASASRTCSR